ncbi:uncharacterized protein LOC144652394 [Oculina patagonica]
MLSEDVEDFIIHLECIDKQEVGGKSPNMEKEALKRAIQQLKNLLNLKEVVTDASSSIIKMMADEFKDIVQSKEYPQVSQSAQLYNYVLQVSYTSTIHPRMRQTDGLPEAR